MARVKKGDVLVTDMTDPNWEPVMKLAAAIVTNRGGRTCHAAIIARELGIPAVVGCGDATRRLKDGQPVTVSCAEGDTGNVFEGLLPFEVSTRERGEMPRIPVKIAMNVGNPELAFEFAQLPNAGVGLARLEFIINNEIGVHPRACLEYEKLPADLQAKLLQKTRGYADPRTFYRDKLVEGVATIAAAFWPKPVIVRLSDFKSNEYKKLLGGESYEPDEENPMLGWRGASRYIAPDFRECFELECAAMRKVREELGLTNVELMVPFVRTVGEAREVLKLLAENGLERGKNNLKIVMMCELPSNAILADEFLELFDGFSIGSNDLTQLTLGLDRDSGPDRRELRRARPGGEGDAGDGDPRLPQAGQVRRHLRAGPLGPPGPRALADGAGDRQPVAQSGYGGVDLDGARRSPGGEKISGCVARAVSPDSTPCRARPRACRA